MAKLLMKIRLARPAAVLSALVFFASFAAAQNVRVQPIAQPREAVLGEKVLYALIVNVTVDDESKVAAPSVPGLPEIADATVAFRDIRERRRESRISIIGGRRSATITHGWEIVWEVTPKRAGAYTVPGFDYRYLGTTHDIRPTTFRVAAEAPGNEYVDISVTVSNENPYVNEPVVLRYVFKARKPIDPNSPPVIDIPWASPPNGFVGGPPLSDPTGRGTRVSLNGELFVMPRERAADDFDEQMSFEQRLFPLAPGTITLQGTTTIADIVTTVSGRGRLQRYGGQKKAVISTKPITLTIRDAPLARRPASYGGAIGNFTGEATLGNTAIRAGDGITLTLKLRGQGALESVEPPELTGFDKFDVYVPDRRVEGTDGERELVISWLLVPERDPAPEVVPRFEFSWFDPSSESFKTVSAGPKPLTITGTVADSEIFGGATDARRAREVLALGEGVRPIRERLDDAPRTRPRVDMTILLVVVFLPILSMIGTSWFMARRRRLKGDDSILRKRGASRAAEARLAEARALLEADRGFEDRLARSLTGFVGDKLDLPPGRVSVATSPKILADAGVSEEVRNDFVAFLGKLETVAFSGATASPERRREDLDAAESLIRRIDKEVGKR